MANPITEGPVPLAGAGFIAKENGNFQPGEYKRLSNLEIDSSGVLVNRRNVYSVFGQNTGSPTTAISNPQRFLGNLGEYSIISDGSQLWAVGDGTFIELWDTPSGGPVSAGSFSEFIGYFRYNNIDFWLVLEVDAGVTVGIVAYYADVPDNDAVATYAAAGYEATLTRDVLISFAVGSKDYFDFQFRNFFVYKDRLWLATSVGLYFSAATNPLEFTVPSGGFFKYPDNVVTWAMAVKDNVYILCEDSVYALTYATDPNLDSSQRPLSNTIGGEMGVIHLDIPYFINNLGIFSINNNNVDKVMDSRFDYGSDFYRNRLFSFEQYLIVNKYSRVNYNGNYTPPSESAVYRNYWPNGESTPADPPVATEIDNGWSATVPSAVQRRNRVENPSMETNLTNWFESLFYDYTTVRNNTVSHEGTWSLEMDRTSGPAFQDVAQHSWIWAVDEGEEYTASVWVYLGTQNIHPSRNVVLQVQYVVEGLGEVVSEPFVTTSVDVGEWTRLSLTSTCPVGANFAQIKVTYKQIPLVSNPVRLDGVLFEHGDELLPYFDGASADVSPHIDYSWVGSAHASASLATYTPVTAAVGTTTDAAFPLNQVLEFSGSVLSNDTGGTAVHADKWAKFSYVLTPSSITPNSPYYFFCSRKATMPAGSVGNVEIKFTFRDSSDVPIGSTTREMNNHLGTHPWASFQTLLDPIVPPSGTDDILVEITITWTDTDGGAYEFLMNNIGFMDTDSFFNGGTTDTEFDTYAWTGDAFNSESTKSPAETHGYLQGNGSKFSPFESGNSLGYNTYFINMENGAVHVLDFVDQYISYDHGEAGFIVDAITNPLKDSSGNYKWFFLTNKMVEETTSTSSYEGFVYYLSSSEDRTVNDYVVDSDQNLLKTSPRIDVEIDSFVPDGNEYRTKKFRVLEFMGVIPPEGISLSVGYDNSDYTQEVTLGDSDVSQAASRKHYAHRVGLNQRGQALTLRFVNDNWLEEVAGDFGIMEFSDIRALWTYTAKHAPSKSVTS